MTLKSLKCEAMNYGCVISLGNGKLSWYLDI